MRASPLLNEEQGRDHGSPSTTTEQTLMTLQARLDAFKADFVAASFDDEYRPGK
jgi:hypothetical protein